MIRKDVVEECAKDMAHRFNLTPEQTREFVTHAEAAYKKAGGELLFYLAKMKAAV